MHNIKNSELRARRHNDHTTSAALMHATTDPQRDSAQTTGTSRFAAPVPLPATSPSQPRTCNGKDEQSRDRNRAGTLASYHGSQRYGVWGVVNFRVRVRSAGWVYLGRTIPIGFDTDSPVQGAVFRKISFHADGDVKCAVGTWAASTHIRIPGRGTAGSRLGGAAYLARTPRVNLTFDELRSEVPARRP